MNDSTTLDTTVERTVEIPPAAAPELVPLETALEAIRLDSLHQAELYLLETTVPDGGE